MPEDGPAGRGRMPILGAAAKEIAPALASGARVRLGILPTYLPCLPSSSTAVISAISFTSFSSFTFCLPTAATSSVLCSS